MFLPYSHPTAGKQRLHYQTTKTNETMQSPLIHVSALDPAVPPTHAQSEAKAHRHRSEKTQTEQCRPDLVVVRDGAPLLDHVDAPDVQTHRVKQCTACDDGEGPSRCERKSVAKVEQRSRDRAEKDAKLEPGEEGTFGSELDFGFDTHRDVYAFSKLAWSEIVTRSHLRFPLGALKCLTSPGCFQLGTPSWKPPSPTSVAIGRGTIIINPFRIEALISFAFCLATTE